MLSSITPFHHSFGAFMSVMRARNLFLGCVVDTEPVRNERGAEELDPKSRSKARERSIFVAKCSECHGRGLSRPRAALYLNELGPLAANREWVVPHEPEKSYLWTLIRDDDMPAKGAKAGPLNAEEKQIVRAWIEAGAPAPPSSASTANATIEGVTRSSATAVPSLTTRFLAWFGRFHVLVIHVPIALLAAAAGAGNHCSLEEFVDSIADGSILRSFRSGGCHRSGGAGMAARRRGRIRKCIEKHPCCAPLARNRRGLVGDCDPAVIRARSGPRTAKRALSHCVVHRHVL